MVISTGHIAVENSNLQVLIPTLREDTGRGWVGVSHKHFKILLPNGIEGFADHSCLILLGIKKHLDVWVTGRHLPHECSCPGLQISGDQPLCPVHRYRDGTAALQPGPLGGLGELRDPRRPAGLPFSVRGIFLNFLPPQFPNSIMFFNVGLLSLVHSCGASSGGRPRQISAIPHCGVHANDASPLRRRIPRHHQSVLAALPANKLPTLPTMVPWPAQHPKLCSASPASLRCVIGLKLHPPRNIR
mmetsp:Transcript_16347/g.37552  ORF Transcript_16347/g.37552 Transcript_16347/m.37552 type:complete len:244 (-) Transcript_16347:727-1458(-)